MDLKALHSLMRKNNFHYFEGKTNNGPDLFISFSTLQNGRGNQISIRIGNFDNDVEFILNSIKSEFFNINDNKLFLLIEEQLNL